MCIRRNRLTGNSQEHPSNVPTTMSYKKASLLQIPTDSRLISSLLTKPKELISRLKSKAVRLPNTHP